MTITEQNKELVAKFATETLEYTKNHKDFIEVNYLYEVFLEWCIKNNLCSIPQQSFTRQINKLEGPKKMFIRIPHQGVFHKETHTTTGNAKYAFRYLHFKGEHL